MNDYSQFLTGLIAAPFTPMREDASVNFELIEKQAARLIAHGVTGAFICGSTGEGLSLTTDERCLVAERWHEVIGDSPFKLIVHAGHNSLEDAKVLAAHAQKIGADAVSIMAPCYFKPGTIGALLDFCAPVAAAAADLPFYYYHIPAMTGVDLPMLDFLRVASRRIPNLTGIKFTHQDLMDYSRCLDFEEGRFNILFGRDEMLLAALSLGATGAVGSTYNYMAPLYYDLMDAFNAGDLNTARHYQSLAVRIIALMCQRGGLPAGKAMMKLIGLDCGPVRAPLANLSSETLEAFSHELKQAGFPLKPDASLIAPLSADKSGR